MIRFRIAALVQSKEEALGRAITWKEVAEETGISAAVISNLASPRGGVTTNSRFIEALLRYFRCEPNDLIVLDPPIELGTEVHVNRLYPQRNVTESE